jgi:hypothetical protein
MRRPKGGSNPLIGSNYCNELQSYPPYLTITIFFVCVA